MMRALLLTAAVVIFGAVAALAGSTASAAAPVAISIEGTVIQFGPPPQFHGVWHSSGAFSDAGTFVETEYHATGSLPHSPVVGAFQAVIVFSGPQGTFTVAQEAIFTPKALGGHWQVVSGTGAYDDLNGHGSFEFVFPNSLTFTGVASEAT
jgi:Protein of unknown function (DUF3224)